MMLPMIRRSERLALLVVMAIAMTPTARADGDPDAKPVPSTTKPVSTKLVQSTWAPTGFLKNPTALSFDREGRCYVSQTQRREGGEMTTRDHPKDRLSADFTFTTVDDRM